jgi:hypothetical protein
MVECDEHGSTPGCLICRHLCAGRSLGYWAIKPNEHGPAQAWCDDCDVELEKGRGWPDRAFALADFRVYCSYCYDKTLKRHKLRGWCDGGPAPAAPKRKRQAKKKLPAMRR